ncbi:ATP-binding protein [Amycolatopsis acidicola]|uniref:ATP-binding protein n=1 Tax=Amycolatopsis acidicola TaxID=2596893 RepID=UPI001FB84500|nr:ATP-binding protein [Amycolatopsis acidicola]
MKTRRRAWWACVCVILLYVLVSPWIFRLGGPWPTVLWLAVSVLAVFGAVAAVNRAHVREVAVDSRRLALLREESRVRQEAGLVALVALARKVQSSAHRIQEEATRMVQRHPADADVLETSMRVDHAAAQQARQAQTLAALCGEWPGQQWREPLPLTEVVRAAAGRITAYQRVEVTGDPSVTVAARVVEPLIHLVAELLANATQSSPPSTQVLATLRPVQRGAVLEIDDCGVGLEENRLAVLRRIASGEQPVGLFELGAIPQTGLPVVGAYVRRYGFRVDLTESVYGGLRAIVLVPAELTETPAPEPVLTPGAPALPQRRSRRGEAQAGPPPPKLPEQTPEQAGNWMSAFLDYPKPEE